MSDLYLFKVTGFARDDSKLNSILKEGNDVVQSSMELAVLLTANELKCIKYARICPGCIYFIIDSNEDSFKDLLLESYIDNYVRTCTMYAAHVYSEFYSKKVEISQDSLQELVDVFDYVSTKSISISTLNLDEAVSYVEKCITGMVCDARYSCSFSKLSLNDYINFVSLPYYLRIGSEFYWKGSYPLVNRTVLPTPSNSIHYLKLIK